MTCSDDSSFVDMFNGLRKHVPVQFSTVDVSCTRIYHALNLMWEVGDNIEMSELLLDKAVFPQIRKGGPETIHADEISQKLPLQLDSKQGDVSAFCEKLQETNQDDTPQFTTGKRKMITTDMEYALMHTYPNHDTVCGNIEKSRRTEPGRNARPPISPVKKLSTQTSFNIYNKMKAYRTPAGVYDRTTSHSLMH